MRPDATSIATSGVTGTPTVRYAVTNSTAKPSFESPATSVGSAISDCGISTRPRMSLAGHSLTSPRAELSEPGTKSTRYPASARAAAVVSPTAAMRVESGTRVP